MLTMVSDQFIKFWKIFSEIFFFRFLFLELRTLTASLVQPSTTTMVSHASNSSPTMHGSVAVDSSNQTPPLSPRSYTQQIPSPIFTTTTNGNTTLNNSRYMQEYVVPQSQSMVGAYTSAAYSPISSPYYSLPSNNLLEHEIKMEGISAHSTPHTIQHAHHHHQMSHMTSQQHSRSPSIDDDREFQSQIVSRNLERPSVVNIKQE